MDTTLPRLSPYVPSSINRMLSSSWILDKTLNAPAQASPLSLPASRYSLYTGEIGLYEEREVCSLELPSALDKKWFIFIGRSCLINCDATARGI